MTIAETLRAARVELERRGWCQRFIFDRPTGRCCLMGALSLAAKDDLDDRLAWRALTDVAGVRITAWNDRPGRTVEDVYALIDKAIAAQEVAK